MQPFLEFFSNNDTFTIAIFNDKIFIFFATFYSEKELILLLLFELNEQGFYLNIKILN